MGIVARPTPALLRQPGGMKLSHLNFSFGERARGVAPCAACTSAPCACPSALSAQMGDARARTTLARPRRVGRVHVVRARKFQRRECKDITKARTRLANRGSADWIVRSCN